MGLFDTTVDQLRSPEAKFEPHPQLSGKHGGHTLNLHRFARDGVILLGHVCDVRGGTLLIVPDMKESLAKVDRFEIDTLKRVDAYIARMGLEAPAERVAHLHDGYEQDVITELSLRQAGVTAVIWATGYHFDYGLVKLPVVDQDGYPIQERGATRYDGLYFLSACPGCTAASPGSCSALERTRPT
jgi:putative flavoprotein involved in K+ transport